MGSNGKSRKVVVVGERFSRSRLISKKMLRRSGVDESLRDAELLDWLSSRPTGLKCIWLR